MEEKNTNETNETKEKQTDKKTEDKSSKGLKASFKDFRGEFKKIIWPNRKELIKSTITVAVTSLFMGAIIFVMDTIYSFGYTAFIDLLTK